MPKGIRDLDVKFLKEFQKAGINLFTDQNTAVLKERTDLSGYIYSDNQKLKSKGKWQNQKKKKSQKKILVLYIKD